MASSKDVMDILECNVCMSQLNNPKMLHCSHEFCKECLDELLVFKADGTAGITCPLRCAGSSFIDSDQTLHDLGVSYRLKHVLACYKDQQEEPVHCKGKFHCKDCESNVTMFCYDCMNFYCRTCERNHGSHGSLEMKYNEQSESFLPICKKHNTFAKFVCCNELICRYCQHRQHGGHHYDSYDVRAGRIRQYIFEEYSTGKIDRVMKNAMDNYKQTLSDLTTLKSSLVTTLKTRINSYILEQLKSVENEAIKIIHQLDEVIHDQMKVYGDMSPSANLNVIVENNLELILKQEHILKEYSKSTSAVPTLTVSLTEGSESHVLGELNVHAGEVVSIGDDENRSRIVNEIHKPQLVHDTEILVKKLEDLMKEVDGELPPNLPTVTYSEQEPLVDPEEQQRIEKIICDYEVADNKFQYVRKLIASGQKEVVKQLVLRHKEVTNLRHKTGLPLMYYVIKNDDTEQLLLFIETAGSSGSSCKYTESYIHYAVWHSSYDVLRVLLDQSPHMLLRKVTVSGKHEKSTGTPYEMAVKRNNTMSVAILDEFLKAKDGDFVRQAKGEYYENR